MLISKSMDPAGGSRGYPFDSFKEGLFTKSGNRVHVFLGSRRIHSQRNTMARLRLEAIGLVLAFVLIGSLAYYSYTVEDQLRTRNSQLDSQVVGLQAELSELQTRMAELQASFSLNLTSTQDSLLLTSAAEANDAQQISSVQAILQRYQSQLSNLSSEITASDSANGNALNSISLQLQNITAGIRELNANLNTIPPSVLLRTSGTALGAFVRGPDELLYLRLTEIGNSSCVEASLASHPFNATMPGSMVEWKAAANNVSADAYHAFWPMVLENTPGGTNALEFEDYGGFQEAAVVSNGVRSVVQVSWDPTAVNTFAIEVVSPGHQVNFYINGASVANFTSGVPMTGFLLEGAEVKGYGLSSHAVATLDVYGGQLGGA